MTFEVGDKVRCHRWEGEGKVISVIKDVAYPVLVAVENGTLAFTAEGKGFTGHAEPCLRHAATGKPVIVGEEPKRKWKPANPTWCWVYNSETQTSVRRLIIGHTCDGYLSLTEAGYSSEDHWLHARPCESDVPAYWPKEWV